MDKVKCPILYPEVEERNFKETYISPYNNQDYKRYDCPNCDVHWWRPLKIIPEFYKSIVPSIWCEALEMVVVESSAFGAPVIGSNTGSIPKMILEGINGMLFDPYKEGDLEEKMLKFESEISDWRSKSEIIKQSAQKFLDYEGWLNQWGELYKLVVSGEIE
jgi:glycosyltransferase involved in cell wall biosynthesis